jgi:PAS domain-containing protein
VADAQVQRNWLEAFVEQAPVGIALFLETNFRIELVSLAICELWGRTPPQVLGKPLF